jgi:hypothetical protein
MQLRHAIGIVFAALFMGEAKADVQCVFDSRSTQEGLEGLDGHAFRVSGTSDGLELEARAADGTWLSWGQVERTNLPEYLVFQRYPRLQGDNPSTLTIHKSGRATLLLYVDPYRTWLHYGECAEQ